MSKFTKSQKMQLIGLHAVYQSLWKQCMACEQAAAEIIGEEESYGGYARAGDFISDDSPDFKRLEAGLKYDEERKNANS